MQLNLKNRLGTLRKWIVDNWWPWLLVAAAAVLLIDVAVKTQTDRGWGTLLVLALGVAGLCMGAYAAAHARARARYEAFESRMRRECDHLIEQDRNLEQQLRYKIDALNSMARKLRNRDERVAKLTDGLAHAITDLTWFKASVPAYVLDHDRAAKQMPLREALELLDLIDTHHYRGDDGAEWQVTAFRDKPTDAFAYKALPRLVIGKERLEAVPPGAIEFVESETPLCAEDYGMGSGKAIASKMGGPQPGNPGHPVDPLLLIGKLPHSIPMSEVESVSITLGVDETPDPTGLVDAFEDRGRRHATISAADFFHRSQHQQAVDEDRRENRRRYHAERLESLDPDSPLAQEVGRDKMIEILQSGQTAGVQVAEVRTLADRLGKVAGTLQLQKLGDEGNAPLPVVAEAAANVIGVAQTLATMLETTIDQRDQLLGRVISGASNAQMAAKTLADHDEVKDLVRQLDGEVTALRAMPAFGNQTEPLTRMKDLIDQMRRQLHMSGADGEDDATVPMFD